MSSKESQAGLIPSGQVYFVLDGKKWVSYFKADPKE